MVKEPSALEAKLKLLATFVAFLGIAWGATEFLISKRLEAKRPFLDYQLEMYRDAVSTVSVLATAGRDTPEWKTAERRFFELYWGELVLVENSRVEAEMAAFKTALEDGSPYLRTRSYCLSHELRRSLEKSWSVKLWRFDKDVDCSPPPFDTSKG